MRSQAFKPRPDDDPWRCLVAKVIERAVLNLQSANQSTWARTTAAMFLADETVESLCDAWGLWLPWRKIQHLARQARENVSDLV